MLTPEQAMLQAAITKNSKLLTSPNASLAKPMLPMPPGIKVPNSTIPPKQQQDVSKPFLSLPSTLPKLLPNLPLQRPPLPSTRPPLPAMPPPPPPPSHPPLPPTPNQLLMAQGVPQLPPPPLQPPPISPSGFPPMYPPYSSLQNAAQSFANSMFTTQPPSLIPPTLGQYRSHETMATSIGVQFIGDSGPPRPPYGGENYNQRENQPQQQSQPPPPLPFSEFELQDAYEERQKYIETRAFTRDGVFVGGNYGNGSQHFSDGSSQHYSENSQHYVDGGGQHYSDPIYQQYRGNTPNKRGFSNRNNRPLPPPPQYQNRQVRSHPYQRR